MRCCAPMQGRGTPGGVAACCVLVLVLMLVLGSALAAPAGAAGASGRSTVTLKRLGAAPVAGSPVRLRVRVRVRRGRFITRHIVSYGRGVRPRHGLRRPRELRHTYARPGRYRVTLTLIDNRKRRIVDRLWIAVRRAPAIAPRPAPEPPVEPPPVPSAVVIVPPSIPADCSANVQEQITSFINAQPDGSTIEFPANGCYAQSDRIMVREKRNLTIDANGSSFYSSAPNTGAKIAGNWLILRGTNVRLTDMRIIGNFHLTGARSPQRVAEATIGPNPNQFNMGVGIFGGSGIHVTDMTIERVFGDGVTAAVAHYIDGSAADPLDTPSDVHIERIQVTKTARHCVSPSQGDGVWLQDSTLTDCWYGAFDGELDDVTQKLKNVHILRNTLDGFFMFGIAIPVAGDANNTENIEIRDNTIKTRPDNVCNNIIEVGSYPTNRNTFKNVVVANNTLLARSGLGVSFDHVETGSISDNVDGGYFEAGCAYPASMPFSRVTNSIAITLANNAPRP